MYSTYLNLALLCHPVLAVLSFRHAKLRKKCMTLQTLFASFLALLAIKYACSHGLRRLQYALPQLLGEYCTSVDQPNPIAARYPRNCTGTLNGTVSMVPIPLALARQVIPPQYGILEHAYRALLPSFPEGMYPAIVQALHDHEVQAFGYRIADFSVRSSDNIRSALY